MLFDEEELQEIGERLKELGLGDSEDEDNVDQYISRI